MYLYPENLTARPMLWLWTLRDVAFIGVGLLLSVLALTQAGTVIPLVVTAALAFLCIRHGGVSHAGLSALRRSVLLFRAAILRMEGTSMRKKKSTQQLVGIESVTDSSVLTAGGELTFYLVQPTNLNVLPESGVRTRVTALLNVLKASAEMELLALDAKESYQDNRLYYRRRAEEEGNPAIRALLAQDRRHLDDVQTMMASSRQFCFVLRRRKTDGAINLATVEQRLRDSGFTVRRVEGTELLELLAIYFEQDATHEVFDLVDGARWLTAEMEEENADFES